MSEVTIVLDSLHNAYIVKFLFTLMELFISKKVYLFIDCFLDLVSILKDRYVMQVLSFMDTSRGWLQFKCLNHLTF